MDAVKAKPGISVVRNLDKAVTDIRSRYETARREKDRNTKLAIIKSVYDMEWKPTVGFIADVVNEPRGTILATIQDQGWRR